jgi:hypothetical protein
MKALVAFLTVVACCLHPSSVDGASTASRRLKGEAKGVAMKGERGHEKMKQGK